MSSILEIKDLHAEIEGKSILQGVDLTINPGEVHAIMGPNGSGKSTLSNILLGHPAYKVTKGDILFKGNSILNKTTDERARLGIFLSFQYPTSLPGITIPSFFRTVLKNIRGKEIPMKEFKQELKQGMKDLEMPDTFLQRYVNHGFSGGEKKRNEILQMSMMKPILSILDETDSGLDIDALRIVSEGITRCRTKENSILLITHYQRMLNYVVPDFVHIFAQGKILETGNKDLALKLEEHGYDWILEKAGIKS